MKKPLTVNKLLTEYKQAIGKAKQLFFADVGERDVYNITAPFRQGGKKLIAGRVERRDSEDSEVMFFTEKTDNCWYPVLGAPVFNLQDPFWTVIAGQFIFGGVEVYSNVEKQTSWRTVLYKGQDLFSLQKFFVGPAGMKDIRLHEMPAGKIVVLTRPQGKKGGRGKIGYLLVNNLAELTCSLIESAPLLANFVHDDEWVGANAIYNYSREKIGVLGHIARFSEGSVRHYYSLTFILNPYTGAYRDVKIIATRKDFLPSPAKRCDLIDVVFSGGLEFYGKQTILYAGISDASAQKLIIANPFI